MQFNVDWSDYLQKVELHVEQTQSYVKMCDK